MGVYIPFSNNFDYKWTAHKSVVGECIINGSDNTGAKPDLKLNNFDFNSSNGFDSGNIPLIRKDSKIYFSIRATNSGINKSNWTNLEIFVSKSSTFNFKSPGNQVNSSYYIGSLDINNFKDFSEYIYTSNYNHIFDSTGYYYFHFVVDQQQVIDETKENNNVITQKTHFFYYSSKQPKNLFLPKKTKPQTSTSIVDSPYTISIHKFSGVKVLEKEVQNEASENEVISNLPKGLYIINSIYGSRKIYVKE